MRIRTTHLSDLSGAFVQLSEQNLADSIMGCVDDDSGDLDPEAFRDVLIEMAQEALADDCVETETITVGGECVLLAGGMSWGDPPSDTYTQVQVLREVLDFLDGDPDKICDECGSPIPDVDGGGLANMHHLESCSLYDPKEE